MLCCALRRKNNNKVHKLEDIFEPRPPEKNTKQRRISIYPKISKQEEIEKNKKHISEKREEYTNKILSEIIKCGACEEKFSINDKALQINCGSCNKVFHCGIAGVCVGPNCTNIVDGKKQSTHYCMNCVNPYLKINIQSNGQCLCKSCEESTDIPNYYRDI